MNIALNFKGITLAEHQVSPPAELGVEILLHEALIPASSPEAPPEARIGRGFLPLKPTSVTHQHSGPGPGASQLSKRGWRNSGSSSFI